MHLCVQTGWRRRDRSSPGAREARAGPCGSGWWSLWAAGHLAFRLIQSALPPHRNGYQKFSQELLSNGELNHLPLKERMVEIGSRWQRISQGQKDHYKKLAEEQQKQYKVHLDIWLKVSPEPPRLVGGTLGAVVLGVLAVVSAHNSPLGTTISRPFFGHFFNIKGL